MTQIEAVKAYKVLTEIGGMKMPVQTAYKLFTLKKALQPAFEFQVEQERAIAERYQAFVDHEGVYHTWKDEDKPAFAQELYDLGNAECSVEVKPIEIQMGENILLSPDDMAALDPFVTFNF